MNYFTEELKQELQNGLGGNAVPTQNGLGSNPNVATSPEQEAIPYVAPTASGILNNSVDTQEILDYITTYNNGENVNPEDSYETLTPLEETLNQIVSPLTLDTSTSGAGIAMVPADGQPAEDTPVVSVTDAGGADVDAKAARTRRSLEEQAQPDRGVFAYEGPEAAMSEASIETNLSTEQKRSAQSALNELGFSVGSADGVIGNRTRSRIAQYQVTLGLPPTGFLDERTQDALNTGTQGRPLSEVEAEFDFIGGTKGGRALRAAEELRYNAYSLNHQPVLSGNRKHNSGLTLGVGVDLGQQSAEELRELGVPNRIVEKLEQSGFLGVTPENIVEENDAFRRQGHAALLERYQEQMQNGTLVTLTPEEMDTLTQVLYEEKYMPTVEEIYNSTSYSEDVPFDELSEEARAALGAEAWHYTNNLRDNASAFARAASRNDIRGITNLYLYPERGPKVLKALGVN